MIYGVKKKYIEIDVQCYYYFFFFLFYEVFAKDVRRSTRSRNFFSNCREVSSNSSHRLLTKKIDWWTIMMRFSNCFLSILFSFFFFSFVICDRQNSLLLFALSSFSDKNLYKRNTSASLQLPVWSETCSLIYNFCEN